MDIEITVWIHKKGSDITTRLFQVPIILCPHSTGPKILDEVETFEERCWMPEVGNAVVVEFLNVLAAMVFNTIDIKSILN